MPDCPRCHRPVKAQAITCPSCHMTLKAYGHPGIPLHRAVGPEPLCQSCTYHLDDTCTFPQRPDAWECTLYEDVARMRLTAHSRSQNSLQSGMLWLKRNSGW
ncbi:MAG: zinc ribbon domain-containing protein, partial [Leptolyngbyaceae cyanobacterium bins.59]|nr:zinc ribbon domain-containing protein [Leptolyngbyaceae cyanobacterium bins.59]